MAATYFKGTGGTERLVLVRAAEGRPKGFEGYGKGGCLSPKA